jgi:glycosyltransferase involved in cell wall biosynthesis
MFHRRKLQPLEDRGPLRAMFMVTSMPVGGAETLLVELIRRLDRDHVFPELCCLKHPGPLGGLLASDVPVFSQLLRSKFDLAVLRRLVRLFKRRRLDAVITVGAGDKMFWGRLSARLAGLPVICSALHATGYPDRVQLPNRLLAPITDAFIAVAEPHARYLAKHEGCPAAKIRVVPNGVDVEKFRPRRSDSLLRTSLGLPEDVPTAAVVAALRPEKNHESFLQAAAIVRRAVPDARFLIVGDGPQRSRLEGFTRRLSLGDAVHFLGTRNDVHQLLSLVDVLVLTSHTEANPVSILEAMASEVPVVATRVGSVSETVRDGETGFLATPGQPQEIADRIVALFEDPELAKRMGRSGREHVVAHWSCQRMVNGYERLIEEIYSSKCRGNRDRKRNKANGSIEQPPLLSLPRAD